MNEITAFEIGSMSIAEMYLLCVDICEAEYKVHDIRGTFEVPHTGRRSPVSELDRGMRRRCQDFWPLKSTHSRIKHLCNYITHGGGDYATTAEELDKMFVHEILYLSVASHLWSKARQQQYATVLTQMKILGLIHRHILLGYGLHKHVIKAQTMSYSQGPVDISQAAQEVLA